MALIDTINQQNVEFRTPPPSADVTPPVDNNVPPPAADVTPPPPAADTTPPAADVAPPAPGAFNESEYLTANFGVGNLDEVKTRWTGLGQLEEQNKRLSEETNKYKPAFEALEKAGEVGQLFVNSIAKGIAPETLAQIYKLKPEELSAEDAWKINEKLNKPYLTDAQINAKFQNKFFVDENELDENVKLLKQAELAEESQNARSGIKEYMGKTLSPQAAQVADPAVEEAKVKAVQEQLRTVWQPALPALANSLKIVSKQIPIQTFGAKPGEVTNVEVKYNVPEADQKAIMDQAMQTAVLNGVTPNEAGLKSIQDYAQRLMWASYGPQIAKAHGDDIVTAMTAQFEAVMNNPQLAASIHNNTPDKSGLNPHEQSVMSGMKKQNR